MKKKSFLSNSRGFSLVEVLIATGVLSIFVTTSGLIYLNMEKSTNKAMANFVGNSQVDNILDSIRVGAQNYQMNFSNFQFSSTLDLNQLPMAWDVNAVTTATGCPTCRGRYGFYIQPIPNVALPGLKNVYVRISNSDWPAPSYVDYNFTVSGK